MNEIVIRKVKNGWELMPYWPSSEGVAVLNEVLVFNDMGYASGTDSKHGDETLLGWIEKHMALEPIK